MRKEWMLLGLAGLAACKGQGPETVGSNAAPAGAGVTGTATGSATTTTSGHSFVNPTEEKTYSAIGGVQRYEYSTSEAQGYQGDQKYAGNASTARDSSITIAYNPRDAIFEVKIADTKAGVDNDLRFQDPAHRTDFGGASVPQEHTPNLESKGVRYLQSGFGNGVLVYTSSPTFPTGNAGSSTETSTFFFQKPGTSTKYVTFAGFLRNATTVRAVNLGGGNVVLEQRLVLERAAFAYGERTANTAVPKIGSASFSGGMLASMVYNPLIDVQADAPTYFQWIDGNATLNVDFAASTVGAKFAGTVGPIQNDIFTSGVHDMPTGSTFAATGTARIDLVNAGGFLGQVGSASFTKPGGAASNVNIAGSSIDGAFYGPAAQEVGGGFRIVGGTPDERIDILGTFTGAKP